MSVLKNFESRISGLVEGSFSRVFKSAVRPIEIARRLVREMDAHKTRSLARVYVPNEYMIWLSERDHRQFLPYEDELRDELCGYILEYARAQRFNLVALPMIEFRTDRSLRLGEFGIEANLVRTPEPTVHPPAEHLPRGEAMVGGQRAPQWDPVGPATFAPPAPPVPPQPQMPQPQMPQPQMPQPQFAQSPAPQPPIAHAAADQQAAPVVAQATLMFDGTSSPITSGATVGRSRECNVVVDSPNVSRRHARFDFGNGRWVVSDLGSTNGVLVNGRKVTGSEPVRSGDIIELGTFRLTFNG